MSRRSKIIIYTLGDPRTNEVRYVGATGASLTQRLRWHLRDCHVRTHDCAVWLRELDDLGLRPEIREVDRAPQDAWEHVERDWILCYRLRGAQLTNQTIGGLGVKGLQRRDPKFSLDELMRWAADYETERLLGRGVRKRLESRWNLDARGVATRYSLLRSRRLIKIRKRAGGASWGH